MILATGCDYTAIELGENFTEFMKNKFGSYSNFNIVNADFETYDFPPETFLRVCQPQKTSVFEDWHTRDFGKNRSPIGSLRQQTEVLCGGTILPPHKYFDLVFSAATIQWIPEKIAFTKTFQMLKHGGYLAMFMTRSDEKTLNENLYEKIHEVYEKHFHVGQEYTCRLNYENVVNYGFTNYKYFEWKHKRTFTADEYISYISTHCMHITLKEPYKSAFYDGVREAVLANENQIRILDTIPLYLVQKP